MVAPKEATTNDRSPIPDRTPFLSLCICICFFRFSFLVVCFRLLFLLRFAWRGICSLFVVFGGSGLTSSSQLRRLPVCCLLLCCFFVIPGIFLDLPTTPENMRWTLTSPKSSPLPAASLLTTHPRSACGWGAWLWRVHYAKLLCTWCIEPLWLISL